MIDEDGGDEEAAGKSLNSCRKFRADANNPAPADTEAGGDEGSRRSTHGAVFCCCFAAQTAARRRCRCAR